MSNVLCVYVITQFIPSIDASALGQHLIRAFQNDDRCTVENILIDSQANLISAADLGQAFIICIQKKLDVYFEQIFKLEHVQQIPANGKWGLGVALIETVRLQNPHSLQYIQNHPNFNQIAANGVWGLGSALEVHMGILEKEQDAPPIPSYLNSIIGHPQACQIQFQDVISNAIGNLLLHLAVQSEKKFNHHDQGVVQALLHPNIAHLIQSNGPFGLGRILLNAAHATTFFIVNAILKHPGAFWINSATTDVNEKTQIEKDYDIQCFGFSEIIFAAVNNSSAIEQPSQVQAQVVQALFNFANHYEKPLDVHGSFGLADSLASAATVNELLIPSILNFPASCDIVANAPHDQRGLSDALYNAALEGHVQAIKSILQHPNAYQFSLQNCQDALSAAQRKGCSDAVNVIDSFIRSSFYF